MQWRAIVLGHRGSEGNILEKSKKVELKLERAAEQEGSSMSMRVWVTDED